MFSPCLWYIGSLEHELKLWNGLNSCMICLNYVHENWFLIELNWSSFWALILQIELWIMLFYVVTNVFQENGPKELVLMHLNLVWAWKFKSGNSNFWTHARAGGTGAWAWNSCSQYFALFWCPLERNNWRSSGTLCLMLEWVLSAQSSVIFTYPALLTVLQNARAGKSTLERKLLSACPLERSNLRSSVTPVFWKVWKV